MPHRLFVLSLATALLFSCPKPGGEAAAPQVTYGSVMADISRRFELLGKASASGRWELASYELGEITEQFKTVLPHASKPREGHAVVLPAMESSFLDKGVGGLERALRVKDPAQVKTAFAEAATQCDACHQASGHGFIQVPTELGKSIPVTDPAAP